MDYFSIAVLVIVVFIFITDRKIKSIEQIQKEDEKRAKVTGRRRTTKCEFDLFFLSMIRCKWKLAPGVEGYVR